MASTCTKLGRSSDPAKRSLLVILTAQIFGFRDVIFMTITSREIRLYPELLTTSGRRTLDCIYLE